MTDPESKKQNEIFLVVNNSLVIHIRYIFSKGPIGKRTLWGSTFERLIFQKKKSIAKKITEKHRLFNFALLLISKKQLRQYRKFGGILLRARRTFKKIGDALRHLNRCPTYSDWTTIVLRSFCLRSIMNILCRHNTNSVRLQFISIQLP